MIDTHCHIHSDDYELDADKELQAAKQADISHFICVGTNAADSDTAIHFSQQHDDCFASVGLHPHDAKDSKDELSTLERLATKEKVVAVGECGLDYYYEHSPPSAQESAFRFQIELALKNDLPLIFHVREAFDDFWHIIDDYEGVQGVVHSFTSNEANLKKAIEKGFYVAYNGIMTFTKQEWQLDAMRKTPLENMLVETDTPFLTPSPYRGKVNSPKYVRQVVEFLASQRQESFDEIAKKTTSNARELFGI